MSGFGLTPEELALELGRRVRWVKEEMASGRIPSVKIGNRRYFTEECRRLLIERQLGESAPEATPAPPVVNEWGQVTRGKSA